MNISTIMRLLPAVGPAIAALPEFKAMIDEIISTFNNDRDQDDLKAAYALAVERRDDAHAQLQALVAGRG